METRAFYNHALAKLPPASRVPMMRALAAGAAQSVLLEMLVGRFLQLRGAVDLQHEPEINGRHVDWRATFVDGPAYVEAMAPVYNAESAEKMRRHERLLGVVEELAPNGWWLMPFHLPALPGEASLRPFRALVERLVATLPVQQSTGEAASIHLDGDLPEGRVGITAMRATGSGGLGGGAIVAHFDNSEVVIRNAWMNPRKRRQGRSVPPPAFLALAGSFIGADLEDFDNALFGRSGGSMDGVMTRERNPPWAGVIAFPSISPASATDPVLFVAPAYSGAIPAALRRLEVRRLVADTVHVQAAEDHDVMKGIRWASRSADE
jgi:hypothetical protein